MPWHHGQEYGLTGDASYLRWKRQEFLLALQQTPVTPALLQQFYDHRCRAMIIGPQISEATIVTRKSPPVTKPYVVYLNRISDETSHCQSLIHEGIHGFFRVDLEEEIEVETQRIYADHRAKIHDLYHSLLNTWRHRIVKERRMFINPAIAHLLRVEP